MHSKEKIKKIRERALLREYVSLLVKHQNLLNEEGDFFSTDFARMFGLDSIKNVVDTSLMGVKKLATVGVGETKIAAKSLAFALIPGIVPDAGSIAAMGDEDREELKSKLSKIDSDYAETIKKNEEIFDNPDFNMALFMANPGIALGKWASNHAVGEAREIAETILGSEEDFKRWDQQVSNVIRQYTGTSEQDMQAQQQIAANIEAQKNGIARAQQQPVSDDISTLRRDLGIELFGNEREARRAGFLSEQVQQPPQKQIVTNLDPERRKQFLQQWTALQKQLADIIKSPAVQSKMLKTPMVQKGQQILVDEIMDKARQTINSINVDNIKQKYKSNIDAYFKSKKLTPQEEEQQLNDPEFQKEMVKTIKAAFKPAYIQQLETLKKQNPVLAPKVDKAIQELEQIAPGSLAA
jgi:hypothetical protein